MTGGLVCWLAPDGARFVRHHARHALWVTGGVTALALGLWLLSILAAFLVTPTAFAVVSWLATGAWVGVLPFWLWGLIRALRGETLRMPGVTRRIEPASEAVLPAPPPAEPVAAAEVETRAGCRAPPPGTGAGAECASKRRAPRARRSTLRARRHRSGTLPGATCRRPTAR